eukprot:Em0004g1733a
MMVPKIGKGYQTYSLGVNTEILNCINLIGIPIATPGNVVAITTAPTSINVSWDQLPNTTRNGMIIAYEVKYSWPLGNKQLGTIYVNTSGTSNQVVLNRLHECVQYNISVPQPPEVLPSALTATSANLTWSCPLEKNYTVISYSVNVTVTDPSSISAKCVQGLNLSYNFTVPGYQRYIYLMNMSLVPFTSYSFDVLVKTIEGKGYLSMPRSFITLQAPPTSPLNIRIIKVTNDSLHAIGINEAFTLGSLCISVQRCENDITAGTYRVECKIMIFLSLTSAEIAAFVQSIGSLNMSSTAIVLDGNISEDGFCSCALNDNNKGGTYSWPEAVVGETASQKCQYGVFGQNVTRYCSKQVWIEDASACPTEVTKKFSQLSSTIKNQTISTENVVNVTTQLQAVVSQATEVVDQSASNLNVVTTVITQISNISSPNAPVSNDYNYSRYDCVSWNFTAAGGRGNWTTNGCITKKDNLISNRIECQCSHLTNFAILVDISSRVNPIPQSAATKRALETITYIGVSLSLLGLAATIATLSLIKWVEFCFIRFLQLFLRNQRKKDISKYHIQLCCALFGMLLIFVTGIDRTEHFEGCVAVSVLIHYFTLVAVMWMGAEALLMFQKLVIVFVQITTRFIVILSLICWVTPLVPVIIPLAIDRNLLIKHNASDGYCFISNVTVFFAAFLGPILLILAFNAVIFIIVISVIIKHTIKRSNDHFKKTPTIQLMTNIISVFVLFGLTWIFGALTIMKAATTFQIMFTLLNSFQGFLIFIFFCVLNKEIRSSWTQILKRCGFIRDMRSSVDSMVTTVNANTHTSVVSSMDKIESTFTEEVKSQGLNLQITRTLSLHKRHMEEVAKVQFDNDMELN